MTKKKRRQLRYKIVGVDSSKCFAAMPTVGDGFEVAPKDAPSAKTGQLFLKPRHSARDWTLRFFSGQIVACIAFSPSHSIRDRVASNNCTSDDILSIGEGMAGVE